MTYYALTIGPVVDTMLKVRSTRELWGASYLFSRLMDHCRRQVQAAGCTVISPSAVPEGADRYGAGVYPDVLYAQGPEEGYQALQAALPLATSALADEMAAHLRSAHQGADLSGEIRQYLRRYLRLYLVATPPVPEYPTEKSKPSDADPFLRTLPKLSERLAMAELQGQWLMEDPPEEAYLFDFLERINGSPWKQEAFGDRKMMIPTLAEIATADLQQGTGGENGQSQTEYLNLLMAWRRDHKDRLEAARQTKQPLGHEAEEESLIQLLRSQGGQKLRERMRTYHKYVVVGYADGDRVGKTIQQMGSLAEMEHFSDALRDFGLAAAKLVSETYHGLPVFMGGDDLLFFAPVMYGERSFLDLCDDLNALFLEHLRNKVGDALKRLEEEEDLAPSLSFGLEIIYHKFPLFEATGNAYDLMTGKAKQMRNATTFQLRKHSGQTFGETFERNSQTYQHVKRILASRLQNPERFLSSLGYVVQRNQAVFAAIGKDAHQVNQFIDHSFDEPVHGQIAEQFLADAKQLIHAAYREYPEPEQAEQAVYSALRLIHFLKQPYRDDE